jgi:DNA-binding transcriptional MerR regulator
MASTQRPNQDDPLITSHEAAELIGCSIQSLHRWESDGLITPNRTPGGHRRYRQSEVLELIERRSA